jgi:hypothetical protein
MKIRRGAIAALLPLAVVLAGCGTKGEVGGPAPATGRPSAPLATGGAGTAGSSPKPAKPSAGRTAPQSASPASPKGSTPPKSSSSPKAPGEPGGGEATVDPDADENAQPTKTGEQTAVIRRVPGKSTTQCVDVGSQRDVRAGGFVAGAFDDARKAYGHTQPGHSKRTVRLYFVPLHAEKMPGLKLKFTHVSSGTTVTTRQKQVADAEQWKFYDTYTVLEQGGTWRVKASAGPDKGCLIFKLPGR